MHERIVRGDATSATIAAASIVAKVARDRLMARLGERALPRLWLRASCGLRDDGAHGRDREARADPRAPPELQRQLLRRGCRRRSRSSPEAAPCLLARAAAAEMAAHLLETPTIGDRVWTDEPRLPRETRTAFIRRVLLGETEPVETPEACGGRQVRVLSPGPALRNDAIGLRRAVHAQEHQGGSGGHRL
jgi:hypothetical protein